MRKSEILILIIILISFVVGIYFYPQVPQKIASHWNIHGEVDGYLPKFWGLFLLPMILVIMFLLFVLIPRIDPLKENIEKFRKYFDWFIIIIVLFLCYLYALVILWSFGSRFNMAEMLAPAFAVIFYFSGVLIKNAKRNWFIGIRTPWTLSNEIVWEKTHKIGGKLFKISGIIAFIGTFFPKISFWLVIVPIVFTVFYTIIYSYFLHKKQQNT